jgi:hypothetical protein
VWRWARTVPSKKGSGTEIFLYLFIYLIIHTLIEAYKAYAGQKKIHIPSSWSKPPVEAPLSPVPESAVKRKKRKKKKRENVHPMLLPRGDS